MKKRLSKLYPMTWLLLALCLTPYLKADLVWDPARGWYAEGGLMEQFLGTEEEGRSALDWMNKARAHQENGNYFRALRLYKRVYKNYQGSIYAPEALFQSAKIRVARHQYERAFEDLNFIIQRYADYAKFNQVVGQQFEVASQLMEGKRPYYWGLIPGFRDEKAALDYFDGVVSNAPFSRYAPVALLNMALIATKQGKTDVAIDALDRLITNYPNSVLASDAYLSLAQTFASQVSGAYYDQGATRESISYFQDFLILFPQDEKVKDAEEGLEYMKDTYARSKLLIGEFYYNKRGNAEAAEIFFNSAITAAPTSRAAAEAQAYIDRINSGAAPPKSPLDWMFGRPDRGSSQKESEEVADANAEQVDDAPQAGKEPVDAGWNP